MIQLFEMGGPLFMSLVTLPFIAALIYVVRAAISIVSGEKSGVQSSLSLIRSLGLLSLILGILGQAIGLYSAFAAIEQMAEKVSPALLAGGLKVSSITTIWGLICYVLALLMAVVLEAMSPKSE